MLDKTSIDSRGAATSQNHQASQTQQRQRSRLGDQHKIQNTTEAKGAGVRRIR